MTKEASRGSDLHINQPVPLLTDNIPGYDPHRRNVNLLPADQIYGWNPRRREIRLLPFDRIPGLDPADILIRGERLPESGILVAAEIEDGYQGSFDIFAYDGINDARIDRIIKRKKENEICISLNVKNASEFSLGYVHPNEPNNVTEAYLGEDLTDIYPLSDSGILIVDNKPRVWEKYAVDLHSGVRTLGERSMLRLFEPGDHAGVTGAVHAIMSKLIGINLTDADFISSQVRAKFGPQRA